MTNKTEDILDKTDLRTLWSDTLIGMLSDAIQYNWSDNALQEILKELYRKGYKPKQLVRMAEKKFGTEGALRLRTVIEKKKIPVNGTAQSGGR